MKASENKFLCEQSIKSTKCLQTVRKHLFFVPSTMLLFSRMSIEPLVHSNVYTCFQAFIVMCLDACARVAHVCVWHKHFAWLKVNL